MDLTTGGARALTRRTPPVLPIGPCGFGGEDLWVSRRKNPNDDLAGSASQSGSAGEHERQRRKPLVRRGCATRPWRAVLQPRADDVGSADLAAWRSPRTRCPGGPRWRGAIGECAKGWARARVLGKLIAGWVWGYGHLGIDASQRDGSMSAPVNPRAASTRLAVSSRLPYRPTATIFSRHDDARSSSPRILDATRVRHATRNRRRHSRSLVDATNFFRNSRAPRDRAIYRAALGNLERLRREFASADHTVKEQAWTPRNVPYAIGRRPTSTAGRSGSGFRTAETLLLKRTITACCATELCTTHEGAGPARDSRSRKQFSRSITIAARLSTSPTRHWSALGPSTPSSMAIQPDLADRRPFWTTFAGKTTRSRRSEHRVSPC